MTRPYARTPWGTGGIAIAGAVLATAVIWWLGYAARAGFFGAPRATTAEPAPAATSSPPSTVQHHLPGAASAALPASAAAADASSAIADLKTRHLLLPLPGLQADDLQDTFHDRRGSDREHEALDILAPRNTPILAVEDGRIAKLFFSKAGGITIYQFDPTERYAYYYAHLERYADNLAEGRAVKRGDTIGYVGTSGNAPKDTPHLHFAVFALTPEHHWWEGAPVDPFDIWREPTR
jgi:murein DD-endopeptidase MepM/ murein hydrolase activator NlpD